MKKKQQDVTQRRALTRQAHRSPWVVRLSVAGSSLLLVCVVGALVAYAAIQQRDTRQQLFQVGQVQTSVVEVFTPPKEVKRATPIHKKVTVKNTGTLPQFVRVLVQPDIRSGAKDEDGFFSALPSGLGDQLLLGTEAGTTPWVDGGDGYYYYTTAVAAGKETSPSLLTTVTLPATLSTAYDGAKVRLKIKVESISTSKTGYREAWWEGQVPTEAPLSTIDTQLQKQTQP